MASLFSIVNRYSYLYQEKMNIMISLKIMITAKMSKVPPSPLTTMNYTGCLFEKKSQYFSKNGKSDSNANNKIRSGLKLLGTKFCRIHASSFRDN